MATNYNNNLSPPRPPGQPSPAASPLQPPSSSTPGTTHYPPSPRPALEQRLSSKPALRIRRTSRADETVPPAPDSSEPGGASPVPGGAERDGRRWGRNRASSAAGGSPRIPPSTAATVGMWPRTSDVPSAGSPQPALALAASPLHAGAALLSRDARGAAQLTPVPEVMVTSPTGSTHHASPFAPSPHNSIPIPAQPPLRDETVLVTEPVMPRPVSIFKDKKKWSWPFSRKKDQTDDQASIPPEGSARPQDYVLDAAEAQRQSQVEQQYGEDIVDWLDVIDPEVATVSTLSNVQNSLFLPDLGGLYNRTPIINLNLAERRAQRQAARRAARARRPRMQEEKHVSAFGAPDEVAAQESARAEPRRSAERASDAGARPASRLTAPDEPPEPPTPSWGSPELAPAVSRATASDAPRARRWSTSSSSSSSLASASGAESASEDEDGERAGPKPVKDKAEAELRRRERLMRSQSTIRGQYAVLPAGICWDDWTEEEKAELDDHVRHLMHSRRERLRRRMRGFLQFVKQPVGFFITLYAFLITFWGTAWVLFLIGWISVGGRQRYFIEIADQILTALFCVVGIGLAPFRVVDTYHMIYIAHYHHLTWRLRRERNMPKLRDKNDLPAPQALDPDLEAQFQKEKEAPVLTEEQQRKLTYHQMKYHKSHTFYRPHETPTHRAFPLDLLIVITCLLDCHSMLQMALGGTTWGINYHHRPAALTATILSCSLSCNITAGIVISVGTRRTRKKEEVEKRLRQALTEEAMHRIEKRERREREAHEAHEAALRGEADDTLLPGSISRRVDKVAGAFGRDKSRHSLDSDRDPLSPGDGSRRTLPRTHKLRSEDDIVEEDNGTDGRGSPDSPGAAQRVTVSQ